MVRDSGRRDEGKSKDGEKNRQRSNATPSNSSRNIRDYNGGGNSHPGQGSSMRQAYWDGRKWEPDPTLVKIVQNLRNKLETATKDIRELEKETYRVKSPPGDALLLAAEIEFFVAYHSDKAQKFKAIQKSLDKRAKTGSRSGSSTNGIEESELLEATKKETIENVQAYDRDTYLAYKKVKKILEERRRYESIVRKYKKARAPIDEEINRMLQQITEYHNELGHDWFVAAGIPYTLLYG
ncbi:hypothetical protein BCON_0036g00320 [Botryotinia convoluta]|uniref:Uncharacterized protein n=1 Tax=Botryotinia convoluta TaxID=54673 RepID=A0A4Z1ILJ9_9HELO|nr:hypothetical protein BCON_0036g00320 [Botryotinia convoluta]